MQPGAADCCSLLVPGCPWRPYTATAHCPLPTASPAGSIPTPSPYLPPQELPNASFLQVARGFPSRQKHRCPECAGILSAYPGDPGRRTGDNTCAPTSICNTDFLLWVMGTQIGHQIILQLLFLCLKHFKRKRRKEMRDRHRARIQPLSRMNPDGSTN